MRVRPPPLHHEHFALDYINFVLSRRYHRSAPLHYNLNYNRVTITRVKRQPAFHIFVAVARRIEDRESRSTIESFAFHAQHIVTRSGGALNYKILRIQFEEVLGLRRHVFWHRFWYDERAIIQRFLISSLGSAGCTNLGQKDNFFFLS